MQSVITNQGKRIEIISHTELCDPITSGEYVRAYCHIHGSDHQRSLSINRTTGWGHCFNAACQATVMVAEWNPGVAERLLRPHDQHHTDSVVEYPLLSSEKLPLAFQSVLLHPLQQTQQWQKKELNILLSLDDQLQEGLIHSQRARLYLKERGIPIRVALRTGVGYLPSYQIPHLREARQRSLMRRWSMRIVFPLVSPSGGGYIGRTLWGWKSGINENVHKALLEQSGEAKRWIKTNPAGWFGPYSEQLSSDLILVEGAFDRLTLLAAGFDAREVVALVGTALQVDWLPPQVRTVLLAFDGDQGGRDASRKMAGALQQRGFGVKICPPPQDKWGKDWNERWQRLGQESIWPLRETYSRLRSA